MIDRDQLTEALDRLGPLSYEDAAAEVLPLRKSSLFGWVLVFGRGRNRPTSDRYLVIPLRNEGTR